MVHSSVIEKEKTQQERMHVFKLQDMAWATSLACCMTSYSLCFFLAPYIRILFSKSFKSSSIHLPFGLLHAIEHGEHRYNQELRRDH